MQEGFSKQEVCGIFIFPIVFAQFSTQKVQEEQPLFA